MVVLNRALLGSWSSLQACMPPGWWTGSTLVFSGHLSAWVCWCNFKTSLGLIKQQSNGTLVSCFPLAHQAPGLCLINATISKVQKKKERKIELFVPPCLPVTQIELAATWQNGPKRNHPATYSYGNHWKWNSSVQMEIENSLDFTRFHLGRTKQNKNV